MAVSGAKLGYQTILGRQGANLTTIATSIVADPVNAQSVTPASTAGIAVGEVLEIIDSGGAGRELVCVTVVGGGAFSAIFQNNHTGPGIIVAPFVAVLEDIKLTGPNQKLDTKDVTHMQSPNGYKEFIAGLREGGEITFEGNYIPKSASQLASLSDFQAGTVSNWCIALAREVVAGALTGKTMGIWSAAGLLIALSPSEPVDDRMTYTGTIKISGKPVLF
jgi:hypothetical protein